MSTPGSPLALEFAAVEKRYGETVALAATSIAVEKGEFVALLGPSGSGKTTALMIWAGFVDPSAGIVRVGGSDMSGVLPHQRDLGMVFQNYALFPHMTVAQNVGFPLEMRRTPRAARSARVAELLELVRLDALASRFPRELSGGQQQRVALARALASSPPAILLDEPLGALDRRLRDEMQLEFRRLHRQTGATMVYVTHDQSEALSMADRVVVMREGRVEQIGNPEEVYERPRSAFVAGFLGEANFFRGRVTHSQGGVLSVSSEHGAELRIHPAPSLPAGSDTLVIVRPERISLMDADAAGAIVRGRLVDAAYAGSERRYRFVLAGGQEVLVSAHVAGARAVAVGEEVGLGWADDAARVVQA